MTIIKRPKGFQIKGLCYLHGVKLPYLKHRGYKGNFFIKRVNERDIEHITNKLTEYEKLTNVKIKNKDKMIQICASGNYFLFNECIPKLPDGVVTNMDNCTVGLAFYVNNNGIASFTVKSITVHA